jgi:hypothetical protein
MEGLKARAEAAVRQSHSPLAVFGTNFFNCVRRLKRAQSRLRFERCSARSHSLKRSNSSPTTGDETMGESPCLQAKLHLAVSAQMGHQSCR